MTNKNDYNEINDEDEEEEYEDYEDEELDNKNQRIIIPIIQGSNVIELKINGGTLPLKKKVPFKKFSHKLMPLLLELQTFIDLEKLTLKKKTKGRKTRIYSGSWDKDSFHSFWSDLNPKQKEFVHIIYENEEISREHLIEDLIKKNIFEKDDKKLINNFAGLSAGLTRKWNNLELEPLWNIKNDKYIMNQDPLDVLGGFFES
ncbi:MAG: hypothetical protein EU532_10815 [Promethearchaeota archaeon]|nr:MAG: hypothetical protein EU532_10815 [Candidatus Lokiarchaeota archaeon]